MGSAAKRVPEMQTDDRKPKERGHDEKVAHKSYR